ncbi:phosphoribosylformylglycinamidine synthasechloroplastic [Aphelenchoides avenae]|nr:phosphoribosylformylglycinamidine synthasechloroplastic [Aphelenchus avenae]
MSIGWFDAFRENGAPTWYGENRTPVFLDLHIAALLSVFIAPTLAFLIILPGIRHLRAISAFIFLFSMTVGAIILVTIHYPCWHLGYVNIYAPYKAFSADHIDAVLGVKVGLRTVNITLAGVNITDGSEDPSQTWLNYNERFEFVDVSQMELQSALEKGLPYPILKVIEYFSVDAGFIGRQYRLAGHYTHVFLWFAFSLWMLQMVLLCFVPYYYAHLAFWVGVATLTADAIFALNIPKQLIIRFPGPHGSLSVLNLQPAHCFYSTLGAGVSSVVVGAAIYIVQRQTNYVLQTFLSARIDDMMETISHCVRFFSTHKRKHDELRFAGMARQMSELLDGQPIRVDSEVCYYLSLSPGVDPTVFVNGHYKKLEFLLSHDAFLPQLLKKSTFGIEDFVVEIGPRLTFTTPYSTNAVAACRSAGIEGLQRLEKSTRYRISGAERNRLDAIDRKHLLAVFGDPMTECEYQGTPQFDTSGTSRESYELIDLQSENAMDNLKEVNQRLGLALDDPDLSYYLDLFRNELKRNPTDVELFDLAQSNSEHSRHWFFRGRLLIDGVPRKDCLFRTIQNTQNGSNKNNLIAFSDNSSAIQGFKVKSLQASSPLEISKLITPDSLRHIIYTAETHNFPTGVCPFPGAATGTGGRIRDVQATGRGAHEIAGIAGYSFGNLHLPDYKMPWEEDVEYPPNFAHPRKVAIEASNGASDYGNKFGEPVICGFARSFGMHIGGERVEYVKPIMFSGGVGSIDDAWTRKEECKPGQLVAKIGGPVYRIGVGGGAASSVAVQGERASEVDFGAVQRGDPEMEQKLHRFIRGCIELGEKNPILSIHDQGAGGNGNVLKEIIEGKTGGAVLYADRFELGDPTISAKELWGAEYQESDAILLDPSLRIEAEKISQRERCTLSIVGEVTGDNRVTLVDFGGELHKQPPVDLDLTKLAEREPKTFHLESKPTGALTEVNIDVSLQEALDRVLRLPSVASKRYLTNKVDRSVTGLVAQQQCVGPLHTPVADVAVVALSYWDTVGAAVGVGEQPVKGLVNAAIGARMSVAEALTNLVFAPITTLNDVKCSGNWMWAAKLPGEGARLVEACDAMCDIMQQLGIAVDGGKDSLSMAAKVGHETVKAPGTLVISAYAPCTDITKVVTPDLKANERTTTLLHLSMKPGCKLRLGGSAYAQCFKQLGSESPDLEDAAYFVKCFECVQRWIKQGSILSGHDVSDGGFITAALEMAFAGNRSVELTLESDQPFIRTLFAEELGLIMEVEDSLVPSLLAEAHAASIECKQVGKAIPRFGKEATINVVVNGELLLSDKLNKLRNIWEETSDRLELMQTSQCAVSEQIAWRESVDLINYTAKFHFGSPIAKALSGPPRVAILREEGSNGDREMAAAFMSAGFEAFDLTMTDLMQNAGTLRAFDGIAFVGGFSYADVLGSAKGWSAAVKFHSSLYEVFEEFRRDPKKFSLGICNGCQLMALLGWIGTDSGQQDVLLDDNECGRFHSGFTTVRIGKSPAIMLRGMEDAVLGVWSSHGEGRFTYRDDSVLEFVEANSLSCVRYCDGNGQPSMRYPENPNGSRNSVAAICSKDGRHLSIMPHPDRSFLSWHWPNYPNEWRKSEDHYSPWIKMFENAFEWSTSAKNQ